VRRGGTTGSSSSPGLLLLPGPLVLTIPALLMKTGWLDAPVPSNIEDYDYDYKDLR
jgi:hypothetical protein